MENVRHAEKKKNSLEKRKLENQLEGNVLKKINFEKSDDINN